MRGEACILCDVLCVMYGVLYTVCGATHLSPGYVHEHSEAGHMIALAADVSVVPEHHLTALS